MTTSEQIKRLIRQGKITTVQFKLRSEDAYKAGVEMVAFSNMQSGMLSADSNSVATTEFWDKLPDREVEGNLQKQYEASLSFINRDLKTIQAAKEFNSVRQLKISLEVFVETLTNAFIHRDYYINFPIRLFVFDNCIEIPSPSILPDSVTEETIKQGISASPPKSL
jgi:predicted HTH transcriptional regulator